MSIQPHFALIALLPNDSHFSSNDSSFGAGPGVCALIALPATRGAANNTTILKHLENAHMLTDSPASRTFGASHGE